MNYETNYCPESDITFLTKEDEHSVEVVGFLYGECTIEDFDLNNPSLKAEF